MKGFYVYRIKNRITGKLYFGKSIKPKARWVQHQASAKDGSTVLADALRRHGIDAFDFDVVARCQTEEEMNNVEADAIHHFDTIAGNGYNFSQPQVQRFFPAVNQNCQ